MSFNKSIENGKEHRKPWIGKNRSKNFDCSCRNHGTCEYCKGNRLYQRIKTEMKSKDKLKEFDTMNGITVKYCVDGFNGYSFNSLFKAENYQRIADLCYFYCIDGGELNDCKNEWEDSADYDNPIQAAMRACEVLYVPTEDCLNFIKAESGYSDMFVYLKTPFIGGWYFFNYMVSNDDHDDDCFLPLVGNEELFAKQYDPNVIPDLNRIVEI